MIDNKILYFFYKFLIYISLNYKYNYKIKIYSCFKFL